MRFEMQSENDQRNTGGPVSLDHNRFEWKQKGIVGETENASNQNRHKIQHRKRIENRKTLN